MSVFSCINMSVTQSFAKCSATAWIIGVSLLWPSAALGQLAQCLTGKAYTDIPNLLCPGYSDILLTDSYSAVICDRPDASYLLLQKLVDYSPRGRAIWQMQAIQKVERSPASSLVMVTGCHRPGQVTQEPESVFSLSADSVMFVLLSANGTLQPQAWMADIRQEAFRAIHPSALQCDPLEDDLGNS